MSLLELFCDVDDFYVQVYSVQDKDFVCSDRFSGLVVARY